MKDLQAILDIADLHASRINMAVEYIQTKVPVSYVCKKLKNF